MSPPHSQQNHDRLHLVRSSQITIIVSSFHGCSEHVMSGRQLFHHVSSLPVTLKFFLLFLPLCFLSPEEGEVDGICVGGTEVLGLTDKH